MRILQQICRHQVCIFIKTETPTPVFFCELCKFLKNTFFHRTPPMTASTLINKNFRVILELFGSSWGIFLVRIAIVKFNYLFYLWQVRAVPKCQKWSKFYDRDYSHETLVKKDLHYRCFPLVDEWGRAFC